MGRLDDAESTLRRLIAKEPKDVDTLISLGQVLMQGTRFSDAAEVLKKAQGLEPQNFDVQLNLARCFARSDQVDPAIGMLEVLQAHESHAYEASMELARLHERMGKNAKAADAIQVALNNLPLAAGFKRDTLVEAMAEMRSRPAVVSRDLSQPTWRDLVNDLENSAEAERRLAAVRIIESIPFHHEDMDKAVLRAMYDKDATVRTIALRVTTNWWRAAGQLTDPRFMSILDGMLMDRAQVVRAMAAWSLGESDHPSAVPILIGRLAEQSEYPFAEIHRSLNRLTFAYIEVDIDEPMVPERMERLRNQWRAWYSANEQQYRRYKREPK
jgi:tetratricopeptide (TPR) repeat protein